jgi:thiamine biosynthesis lipoprotein
MRSRSSIEIRRCRPLLGTLVEVACQGSPDDVDRAFDAIEKVHRLMSFHDPASDVGRINREASHESVKVHPWTWRVLKSAEEFSRKSEGVFDITVGRQLVKWDYLPRPKGWLCSKGSWSDIVLEDESSVRFRRPVVVDLGGIAKGFAVDRAVRALKNNGVTVGIVNAGGDLRTFGSAAQLIHVRHPAQPTRIAGAVRLRERAMATSGTYFERRKYRGKYVAPLVDGQTGQPGRELISVSVAAGKCVIADALTKIVFALREKAGDLLAQYHADALLLERDGAPSWMFHPPSPKLQRTGPLCDTRDRIRFD